MQPGAWAQGAYALNAQKKWTLPAAADARQWCAVGAIVNVVMSNGGDGELIREARNLLHQAIGGLSIPRWNDNPERKRHEVISAFSAAIELAKNRAEDGYAEYRCDEDVALPS